MNWTCGPCNANGHDRCEKTRPDPFAKINAVLGLPNVDMHCACEHVSHQLVTAAPPRKTFNTKIAEVLDPVICDGIPADVMRRYAAALRELGQHDHDPHARIAAEIIDHVLFLRVTEGVLSS